MNYFDPPTAAQRYARGRPDFHSNTINHIKTFLQLDGKLDSALDVACGTGLSTRALLEIATTVYGTDISHTMLNLALEPDKIHYLNAPAENQPFPDNSFDLITVSSGVHWFDIDQFLTEANRLLKNNSWLVLYENHFIAEMAGDERFTDWFHAHYLKKYPSPPRNNTYNWTNEVLLDKHFRLVNEEVFKNPVTLKKKQLILYFTTQSNIISAVEYQLTDYEEAERWLDKELEPFFKTDESAQIVYYGNWIKYLQKIN